MSHTAGTDRRRRLSRTCRSARCLRHVGALVGRWPTARDGDPLACRKVVRHAEQAARGFTRHRRYAKLGSVADVRLTEGGADNWRACAALRVTEDQRRWVAEVAYYLCLCAYGETWHPLAIEADDDVVGFLMWGVDDDQSRWIGGLVVDAAHQRRGIARAAVVQAVRQLAAQPGCTGVALSYSPDNQAARALYTGLGFVETGETADEGAEAVSRLSMPAARQLAAGQVPRH